MLGVVVVSTFEHYVGITCHWGIDSNCVHYVNLHSIQFTHISGLVCFLQESQRASSPCTIYILRQSLSQIQRANKLRWMNLKRAM